jgi:hypothetical protein
MHTGVWVVSVAVLTGTPGRGLCGVQTRCNRDWVNTDLGFTHKTDVHDRVEQKLSNTKLQIQLFLLEIRSKQ